VNASAIAHAPSRAAEESSGTPARLWAAIIVGYATLLPEEMNLAVAGANLFPWRIAAILVLPLVIRSFIKEPVRLTIVDFFAAFACLWIGVSLLVTETASAVFTTGASQALDIGFTYLAGRAAIRSARDFYIFLAWMIPGFLAVGAILAAESLTGRVFFRPFIGDLLGKTVPFLYDKPRFGMTRAMGPFAHPIMAGVVTVSFLSLAWYAPARSRIRVLGLVAAACGIFTLSSTMVLSGVLSIGFIILLAMRHQFKIPALAIASFYALLGLAMIGVVSESGILSWMIRNLTLDAGSGYYRLFIWRYAGAEALAHPIWGIGLRDWIRPSWMFNPTIDAYWLVLTMRNGFPLSLSVFGILAGAMWVVLSRTGRLSVQERNTGYGLAITLGVIAFSGISVHIWEGAASWAFLLAGLAVSVGERAEPPGMVDPPLGKA
jgi:hypothetical protein